jgi:hypothetical protein
MTMQITGNTEIDAVLNGTLNPPAVRMKEIYKNDKKTILEFLDDNKDIPAAVLDALLMRVKTLSDYLEILD